MPSQFESIVATSCVPILKWVHGVDVTFKRGLRESDTFTARRRDYVHDVLGAADSFPVDTASREYQFAKADLVLEGETITPQEGDLIIDAGETFTLMPKEGLPTREKVAGDLEWIVRTKRTGPIVTPC